MHLNLLYIARKNSIFDLKKCTCRSNSIHVTICKKALVFATFALIDLLIIVVNVCK